jgi:hypothetical protein
MSPAAIIMAIMPPIECPVRNTPSAGNRAAACPIASASSCACRPKVFSAGGSAALPPYPGRSKQTTGYPAAAARSMNVPCGEPATS